MTDLLVALDPAARERLAQVEADIRTAPTQIRVRFPAAAREIARSAVRSPDPAVPRVEDDVRRRLLQALAAALHHDPDSLAAEVRDLYRYGDADERRAVLLSLHLLGLGDRPVDLVHDGLRTNDPRLVAAALGPYGGEVLDDAAWCQGVLKCLFVGVPLDLVHRWEERTTPRLVSMVAAYADERRAAGRAVPDDAHRILSTAPRES